MMHGALGSSRFEGIPTAMRLLQCLLHGQSICGHMGMVIRDSPAPQRWDGIGAERPGFDVDHPRVLREQRRADTGGTGAGAPCGVDVHTLRYCAGATESRSRTD